MATEQFYWYAVGQFYTETEAMQIVVASTIRTVHWVNYTYWHQAARTSRLRLFYNLHLIYMQVSETFLNKKWQTVMWHQECEQSIHTATTCLGSWGGSLGLGFGKAKTFVSRPRPRPEVPRPRPCHLRLRPRPSWGVLKDPWGQGQASKTTRLHISVCLFVIW